MPALVLRLVPRWLAWVGLAIALCAELSFLAMVVEPLQFPVPDRPVPGPAVAGGRVPAAEHASGGRAGFGRSGEGGAIGARLKRNARGPPLESQDAYSLDVWVA